MAHTSCINNCTQLLHHISQVMLYRFTNGDIRLDPPSRGHPSRPSVSGTSVSTIRLMDIRLDPPSLGHPSGTSVSDFKSHQRKLF